MQTPNETNFLIKVVWTLLTNEPTQLLRMMYAGMFNKEEAARHLVAVRKQRGQMGWVLSRTKWSKVTKIPYGVLQGKTSLLL